MGWTSAAGEIGAGGWLGRSVFRFRDGGSFAALAQRPIPTPTAVPLPNSEISAAASLADLGSNFLERLGDQSRANSAASDKAIRARPPPEAAEGPLYRSWRRSMESQPEPGRSSTLSVTGVSPRAVLPE